MFLGYVAPGNGFTVYNLGSWLGTFLAGFFGLLLMFFKKSFNHFKKYRRFVIIIVFAGLVFGLGIMGIMNNQEKSRFDHKIIILGFDGLSPNIMESMMKEGRLPHFSRLKDKGSYRHLAT